MTPSTHVAVRTAAFAIVAIGVFAVLFLRLWFLQILQGDQFVARANANQQRIVRVPAPRGRIVDANGKVLVENRVAIVASLRSGAVPATDRTAILNYGSALGRRSAELDDLRTAIAGTRRVPRGTPRAQRSTVRRRQRSQRAELRRQLRAVPSKPRAPRPSAEFVARVSPLGKLVRRTPRALFGVVRDSLIRDPSANVALKSNLSTAVRQELLQNAAKYPGITVQRQYRRMYPLGDVAAQIFGGVGQISPAQLRQRRYRGLVQGTVIGQSGLEQEYNDVLQGRDGYQRVQVDAQGQPTGVVQNVAAQPGGKLQLSIEASLQERAQNLLQQAVTATPTGGRDELTGDKSGGGLIAMDPGTGQIKAIASFPTFDPNILQRRISQTTYDAIFGTAAGSPAFNRVTQSTYPTGSTFKVVTASAALAQGIIGPGSTLAGGQALNVNGQRFQNSGGANFQALPLPEALTESSDIAFYRLGQELFYKKGDPLQTWARRFRFGRTTGIDLPQENKGSLPSAAYIAELQRAQTRCERQRPKRTCNIAVPGVLYTVGTAIQLAIGQGLAATPLQVATAYSGFYDRGAQTQDLHFPVPHLALREQNAKGAVIADRSTIARRTVAYQGSWKSAIEAGLRGVTSSPSGTAYKPFVGWNQKRYPVLAKTGTAQLTGRTNDQAWFVAMVPDPKRPLVVAATVEGGGFGADGAAPMVCKVLQRYYGKGAGSAKCGGVANTG